MFSDKDIQAGDPGDQKAYIFFLHCFCFFLFINQIEQYGWVWVSMLFLFKYLISCKNRYISEKVFS